MSTMLGRLVNRGAVLVEGQGRKRKYTATERLYSIYYKLRRERSEAAVVRNLIHFMTAFYSDAELGGLSSKLIAEAAGSPAIREGIQRAAHELPDSAASSPRLRCRTRTNLLVASSRAAMAGPEASFEKSLRLSKRVSSKGLLKWPTEHLLPEAQVPRCQISKWPGRWARER